MEPESQRFVIRTTAGETACDGLRRNRWSITSTPIREFYRGHDRHYELRGECVAEEHEQDTPVETDWVRYQPCHQVTCPLRGLP